MLELLKQSQILRINVKIFQKFLLEHLFIEINFWLSYFLLKKP
jgi:hypothetical protein